MDSKDIIQNAIYIIVAIITAAGAVIAAIVAKKDNTRKKLPEVGSVISFGALLIFLVIVAAGVIHDLNTPSFRTDILVTNLDGIDPETIRFSELFRDQLKTAAPKLSAPVDIGGDILTEITKAKGDAYQLGRKWSSDIVIWGYYTIRDDFYLQVNVENMRDKNYPNIDDSLQVIVQANAASLNNFSLQKQVGNELSNAVYGIYCYITANWQCSIDQLSFAIENIDTSILTYTDPSVLYRYRGGAYLLSEQYELAISDFQAVSIMKPNEIFIDYLLGYAYEMEIRDYPTISPEFMKAYTAYSNIANNYPEANVRLAVMATGIEDYKSAVEYYEKAIQQNYAYEYGLRDSETKTIIVKAYLQDGISLDNEKEYDAAMQRYERIEKIDSNNIDLHYYRGLTYMHQNENKKASIDFDIYVKNGTNPELVKLAKEYKRDVDWPWLKWFFDWIEK